MAAQKKWGATKGIHEVVLIIADSRRNHGPIRFFIVVKRAYTGEEGDGIIRKTTCLVWMRI